MSMWNLVPLSDISEQGQYGLNAAAMKEGSGVRFVRITDIDDQSGLRSDGAAYVPSSTERLDAYLLEPGDLLMARSGATAGKSLVFKGLGEPAVFAGYLIRFRLDRSKVLPDFVGYYLKSAAYWRYIKTTMRTAAQPNINAKELGALPIPVPPLDEQSRIVDLLSRADGIVRLRREAEKKAAELIPALFLDTFGDPATNPKAWPVRKVSEFVAKFEGGKNLQAGSEGGSEYRILKVSAATSGVYRESESKPAPDGYAPPAAHIVRAGDMLFSRANTEELVGATAIVGSTSGKTLLPDKLWRFVWSEPVEPAYMHALFQSSHVRRELGKLSSGTSASMRNISQGKLYELALPVAPYTKQCEFAERAAAILSIQTQQSTATAKAQATFQALLAKAFRNEVYP